MTSSAQPSAASRRCSSKWRSFTKTDIQTRNFSRTGKTTIFDLASSIPGTGVCLSQHNSDPNKTDSCLCCVSQLSPLCLVSCKIFKPLSRIQQLGSTSLTKAATLVPKLAKPLGTAPPPLILDPAYLIRVGSQVVLFKDVYLLKYITQKLDFGVSTRPSSY